MRRVKRWNCNIYIFIIVILLILLVGSIDYNTEMMEKCANNLFCNTDKVCEPQSR